MAEYLVVSTTAGSRESAADLLRLAVRERLAASGQVFGPALSAFWHLGEFGEGEEWQVLLKTEADRYPNLKARLIESHPRDNPEVTAFRIGAGASRQVRGRRRMPRRAGRRGTGLTLAG
jgi:periplasmic divalent cation tolerance protein